MSFFFTVDCASYYSKEKNSNIYRTEEDEVIEVTTEEQLNTQYSSCINYSDQFVRCINGRRNLFLNMKKLVVLNPIT